MISRLTGRLESIEGMLAVVTPSAGGISYEVLIPMFFAERLASKTGQDVTLTTLQYLEAQGQGSNLIPRLIGFERASDRDFFLLFTTVKGIGNKKALKAMAVAPAEIANAISAKDSKSLAKLPEIGKRLSETIVAELTGRVASYLGLDESDLPRSSIEFKPASAHLPVESEAIEALVALGESRSEAERIVGKALESLRATGVDPTNSGHILERIYATRA